MEDERGCMLNRRGVFTKCYHIDRGKLLQYKFIYSSRMYIVLKKVPEYRYPLYYRKFEIQAASCICESCWLDLLIRR
jgi:hypothetical protein